MREPVSVPENYRCPFCPDHQDDVFYKIELITQPICEGCKIELSHFSDEEELRDDPLITAVEQYLGLPWRACQCILLYYERQNWLHMREAPPTWLMEGTTETPAQTEEQVRSYIDTQIHYIDELVLQFKEQLSEDVLVKIQENCT